MSNDTVWVVLEAKDTSSLLDEIEGKELEWYQKYGRDKCKSVSYTHLRAHET